MLAGNVAVVGHIVRIEGNRIYIRRGETVESYNTGYYRVTDVGYHGEGVVRRIEPTSTAPQLLEPAAADEHVAV